MPDVDYAAALAPFPWLLALHERVKRAMVEQHPLVIASEAPFLIDADGDIASACGSAMNLLRPDELEEHHHVLAKDLKFVAEGLAEGEFDPHDMGLLEKFAHDILRELEGLCHESDLARADALRAEGALN